MTVALPHCRAPSFAASRRCCSALQGAGSTSRRGGVAVKLKTSLRALRPRDMPWFPPRNAP
eukprot:770569-Pyramimonas_sp.AAC.1